MSGRVSWDTIQNGLRGMLTVASRVVEGGVRHQRVSTSLPVHAMAAHAGVTLHRKRCTQA
jgi:hypothetical protein